MKILTVLFVLIQLTASSQDADFHVISRDSVSILVKDTSDYSKEYLDELLNWGLSDSYILNRDSLIINQYEFGLFDTGLKKNEEYRFEGENEKMSVDLVVKRINYSTIEYQITTKKGDQLVNFSGRAHGGVSILGAESDEDDATGIYYFCSEYYSNWKQARFTIRIDSEEGNKAKVIIPEEPEPSIGLNDCPTLRLKD